MAEHLQSYQEIPYFQMPEDYNLHLASAMTQAYEQHGPIFRAHFFEQEVLFLVGPEANRLVLVSERQKFSHAAGWGNIFSVNDLFGRGLLTMDGEEHTQHRRMMNPAFTVSYMERYLPLMNRLIREHVANWARTEEVDLYEETRKLTFDIAAQALTGLEAGEEVDRFRDIFVGLLLLPRLAASEEDFQENAARFQAELRALMIPKIAERRQNPTDDIFGRLVQARDDQGNTMSDDQLIAHINILLVAGHETSTTLSTWLLYLLQQHPDYTQRILQEQATVMGNRQDPTLEDVKAMKVLEHALSEAERLYPPVPNGPRGVSEDFTFQGYQIPAGVPIFYSILGSHMLPSIFTNPTQFDPDRFASPREEHKKAPYSLVGFGGGPRICIGINFAQIEMKAMVSHILRNHTLDLLSGQDIRQFYGATGRPLNGIRMQIKERVTV